MGLVRGVTVLDLITQLPVSAQGFMPASVMKFVDLLNIAELETRTSTSFFVHSGRVQSASEAGLTIGGDFPVEIPGLNVGVPFELAWVRAASDGQIGTLEAAPSGWTLDLFLDRVAVALPLVPGQLIPSGPAAPAHLAPGEGKGVKVYARGVLRFDATVSPLKVRLITAPDPLAPTAPLGTVVEAGLSPPHVLIAETGLGLTVDRLVFDLSDAFTPSEIAARGHGPSFEGMAVQEATFYLPRNLPGVGDVNVGVRDLVVGWAPGPALQGEVRVELGVSPASAATTPLASAGGPAAVKHAPAIKVRPKAGGQGWDDVTSLRGTAAALGGVEFTVVAALAPEAQQTLRWLRTGQGVAASGAGATFAPASWAAGSQTVTLTDGEKRVRRCVVDVVADGPLLVGHRGGVTAVEGQVGETTRVHLWDLAGFHASGARMPASTTAAAGSSVPEGALAEVAVKLPAPGAPTPTPEPAVSPPPMRHARVLMDFHDTEPRGLRLIRRAASDVYGPGEPYPTFLGGAAQADGEEQVAGGVAGALGAWVASLPAGARFVVVGRCCDLGTLSRNVALARERAARGQALLVAAGVGAGQITALGEQDDPPAGLSGVSAPRVQKEWAFKRYYPNAAQVWGQNQEQPERKEGRGVDVYAVIEESAATLTPTPTPTQPGEPAPVHLLVPGIDRTTPPPASASVTTTRPYRVEIKVKWDSPSIVAPIDWAPTLAQVTAEWTSKKVTVPGLPPAADGSASQVQPSRPGQAPAESDKWRLIGRFSTDPRSGQTSYLVSLDSMGDADGLFAIVKPDDGSRVDETVAVALALAPALLGSISGDDAVGAGVRVGALFAAATAAAALKTGSGANAKHVIDQGQVIVEKVEGEVRLRAIDAVEGMKARLTVDYTASFGVQANVVGAVGVATKKPVKVKYKGVGVEYNNDPAKSGLDRVNFIFEDARFEVADPGQWTVSGALGKMLGITAIRLGKGSLWIELDVEFALDLGVVQISRTTIRVSISTPPAPAAPSLDVSIRGIKASIDVPKTLKGQGVLEVASDGFGAAIALDVIPAKLKVQGGFSLKGSMVHIEAGVRFATGLPLGSTGLGVFGLAGRFVANGRRNLSGLSEDDVIARELGWHARSAEPGPALTGQPPGSTAPSKYAEAPGQFAVGLGAYVGTLPDAGFCFSALGMLTIGFPDVSVVFAIDATLLSGATKEATETSGGAPSASTSLIGIVAFEDGSLGIAIRGTYKVPKVLEIDVPIGAWFPRPGKGDAYLRVGSDGGDTRPDRPVTVSILPGLLDLRATAFLMVEEARLLKLGKRSDLNFYGFSIGLGAGMSIQWGGGPIYLKASLSILLALGTRPFSLFGGLYVQGELRLIIIGISVSGDLKLQLTEDGSYIDGEFCGEIDFFFFSIEGCVGFSIGSAPEAPVPRPGPLVSGMSLADKFGRVVGTGVADSTMLGERGCAAWPDAVPVLRFAHGVKVALGPGGFAPTPSEGLPGLTWAGTEGARFLYRLTAVELFAVDTGQRVDTAGWPAAWWLPTFRNATPAAGEAGPSSHEGWDLALLRWEPTPWARSLSDGGEGIAADPAKTIERLCEPAPRPGRYCLLGERGQRIDVGRLRLRGEPSGALPYAPDFRVVIDEGQPPLWSVAAMAAAASTLGLAFAGGGRATLPTPYVPRGELMPLTGGWRLPRFTGITQTAMSMGMIGRFEPAVAEPEVLLAVWIELPHAERAEHVLGLILERYGLIARNEGAWEVDPAAIGAQADLPRVIGYRHAIGEPWSGTLLGATSSGPRACLYVRYRPKAAAPWLRFQVMPYPLFDVVLLRVCGVCHAAVAAADDDDQMRGELRSRLADAAGDDPGKRYRLLDPGRSYEVRVTYDAATWRGGPGTEPPSAAVFNFDAPGAGITVERDIPASFYFRTAPAGTLPDDRVLQFDDQSAFDPRAVVRYLRGFSPMNDTLTHLRDDPLLVWFEVEWIGDLLSRYGRSLRLVVQRTDPRPGSEEPSTELTLGRQMPRPTPVELRELVDQRTAEATVTAPCLGERLIPKEGATFAERVRLEAGGRYDLILSSVTRADDDAPVEIARGHFRASRYRNARELITALGFRLDGQPHPFYPLDLITTGPLPTAPLLGDDERLDATLAALGLDPLPLAGPCTIALWTPVAGGAWRLAGLLLDGDEAIIRPARPASTTFSLPRLALGWAKVVAAGADALTTGTSMELVRSNVSGTRLLFAPAAPVAVGPDDTLCLNITASETWRDPQGNPVDALEFLIGRRSLSPIPLIVAQEQA